jgi:hypothetical protein
MHCINELLQSIDTEQHVCAAAAAAVNAVSDPQPHHLTRFIMALTRGPPGLPWAETASNQLP